MKNIPGQISLFDFMEQTEKKTDINDVGIGTLFRYLRYGAHTLIPIVRDQCKAYLDSVNGELPQSFIKIYGNPKKWKRLPCANCEYEVNGVCEAGGHTCHYEYDVFICDAFKQTIDAKPICQFSNHSCHKQSIWEVADMLDDKGKCPHVCCRKCDIQGCGARCNGSQQPIKEPAILLHEGQEVFLVLKGDVVSFKVLAETWTYGTDNKERVYQLMSSCGTRKSTCNSSIGKSCFHDFESANKIAESYLQEHDVIRKENIRAINTVAYSYIRELDNKEMVAFYSELDNGMLYIKEFMTFHHMVTADKKQKAIKKFMEQQEFTYNTIEQLDYNPVFKNMYRIKQEYDWDYAEANHSYAIG